MYTIIQQHSPKEKEKLIYNTNIEEEQVTKKRKIDEVQLEDAIAVEQYIHAVRKQQDQSATITEQNVNVAATDKQHCNINSDEENNLAISLPESYTASTLNSTQFIPYYKYHIYDTSCNNFLINYSIFSSVTNK